MASRRMIASDIWRDDFIGSLDLFGRLLWVGLIVTCADDQGRILNNPRLIRADVFPLDEISTEQVEKTIEIFGQAGKIIIYEAEGKSLIQITHWWEYQTPSWASASKYPAPCNWTDREKYHTAGNKIASRNWDRQGGFIKLPSELPSQLPSSIEDGEGEGEGEGEVKGEEERTPPSVALGMSDDLRAEAIYRAVATGCITFPATDRENCIAAIRGVLIGRSDAEAIVYLKPFYEVWRGCGWAASNTKWLTDWAVSGSIPESALIRVKEDVLPKLPGDLYQRAMLLRSTPKPSTPSTPKTKTYKDADGNLVEVPA